MGEGEVDEYVKDGETVLNLRACVRDLAALSALPSLWVGREPPQVLDSFLDIISAALRLELVYSRITEPRSGETVEAARAGHQKLPRARVEEIRGLLAPLIGSATSTEIISPIDNAMLRVAVLPLSTGEGAVFAGSRRPDFPTPLESMVLSAALNQITLWMRLTRLLVDTRRVEA